jgi:hypothetical protein
MFPVRVKRGIRRFSRQAPGRFLLTVCAVAFLTSSIPNLHWHAHAGGHAVHEHSAFDAPDVDHHDHDHDHDHDHEADEHGQPDSEGNRSLHAHDSNHSLHAVGMLPPSPVQGLPTMSRLAALAVDAPPLSILIPPYRPPIV